MIVLGLTGCIGMGKSTAANFFRACGAPVFDADACVHRLYRTRAVQPLEAAFPGVTVGGQIDRLKLAAAVLGNPKEMLRLESIVHPMVKLERSQFLRHARAEGRRLAVLDIPLLFETEAQGEVDAIAVVSAPASVQRQRVLARPGMSVEKFEAIAARQTADAEKRRRAQFVIPTDLGLDAERRLIDAIVAALSSCEKAKGASAQKGHGTQ